MQSMQHLLLSSQMKLAKEISRSIACMHIPRKTRPLDSTTLQAQVYPPDWEQQRENETWTKIRHGGEVHLQQGVTQAIYMVRVSLRTSDASLMLVYVLGL